ncbi:hypothetical protein [Roseateles amylovorans]|uniref:Uncharacterized protein n=1 Tax=Roseateles amylovorans TaxID=2978473 RepID=A0ABY6B3S0_9BURK|nr:hypothetical protein [Roseateles amylovorans]UXH78876.1 hypothetical protein N4261_02740 [Roseateles amylovorans]
MDAVTDLRPRAGAGLGPTAGTDDGVCSRSDASHRTAASTSPSDDPLVPHDEQIGGQSQALWSRDWWQWAGSFSQAASPIADRSGVLCASGQSGEVWFLAGTYGTQRTIRSCHVPRGKYLFFPLINYMVTAAPGMTTTCLSVQRTALRITDDVSDLVLEVDGRRFDQLALHRQHTSECFDLGARAKPKVRMFPTAANGYYVMLRPLSPGRHTLNFGGALPSMLQAVSYNLIVD